MDGITDCGAFLQQAKVEVLNLRALETRRDQVELECRQAKKVLEAEKKSAEEEIRRTVKTRREEVAAGYDKELGQLREQQRSARNRRAEAKGEGVRRRIAGENAHLQGQNREIEDQIRILFKKYYVPSLCRSRYYFALYMPHRIGEYLTLALSAAILFLAVPGLIYLLIPPKGVFWMLLVYAACIVVFGAVFVLLGGYIREDNITALSKGRELRDQIHANEKKIRANARAIRRDKNEDAYDLGQYDDEIGKLQQQIDELTERKKAALEEFDRASKILISDEIAEAHKARIAELTGSCDRQSGELDSLEAAIREKNLLLADRYTPYLGKDFLNAERLEALQEILRQGTAASLTEAIQEYRRTHA